MALRAAIFLTTAPALVAGFADGDAFLRWHQFAANMTGNTVLLGIAAVNGNTAGALDSLMTIAAFVAGCAAASLLEGSRATPLLVEAALLCAASFAQMHRWQLALVAAAMGIQNTTIAALGKVQANTSFITGDYGRVGVAATRLLTGRGGERERETLAVMIPLVVAYVFGAAFATLLSALRVQHALIFLVPVLLAVAYVARLDRKAGETNE
jgi:uncharacterized membrane protein YoaK (UPF0700 family)